jgi:phage shock protein A
MDDMRQRLPEMNVKAAEVVKFEKMLAMQIDRTKTKVADLEAQRAKAAELGNQDAFRELTKTLKTEQSSLTDMQTQYVDAQKAAGTAKAAREQYKREMDRRVNEAMHQIARSKQAQMKSQIAELLSSFEIGNEGETLERMTARVDEDLARADARLEIAQQSTQATLTSFSDDIATQEADKEFVEMRRQMGLVKDEPVAERTLEPVQEVPAQTQTDAATETQSS